MKRIWTAFAILLLAAVLCFTEYYVITSSEKQYQDDIDIILEYIENNNKDQALKKCQTLFDDWDKTSRKLHFFLSHLYTKDICIKITTLSSNIEYDASAQFLYEYCAELKHRLHDLKNNSMPYLYNIF